MVGLQVQKVGMVEKFQCPHAKENMKSAMWGKHGVGGIHGMGRGTTGGMWAAHGGLMGMKRCARAWDINLYAPVQHL